MKLSEILQNINFTGNINECEITGITHDSRKVKDGTLFVAIKGENNDGYEYISEAVKKGAAAIIANGRKVGLSSIPVVHVEDTRAALSLASANFFGHPSQDMTIVGITGTNGKTSICQMITHVLKNSGYPVGSLGTLGFSTPSGMVSTGFTTPESVELQQILNTLKSGGIKHAVMEISSHALEMHRIDDVHVDYAIYTHLTQDHLDFHKSMENYFKSKLQLFKNLDASKTAIINNDDEYSPRIIENCKAKIVTYGFDKTSDVHPLSFQLTTHGIEMKVSAMGSELHIESPLIGKFNIYNIMAVIANCVSMGVSHLDIIKGLNSFKNVPGRMEIIPHSHVGTVIMDYAHTPDAYENILSTVKQISSEKKIFTLFGCGGNRDATKRPLMAKIAEKFSDYVFVTSDNPRFEKLDDIICQIKEGFTENDFTIIHHRVEAIQHAMSMMDENTILLVLGKGHDNYEEVEGIKHPHSDFDTINDYCHENQN